MRVQWPGHDDDPLPPSSCALWNYIYMPAYAFMAKCIIKHRDNIASYLQDGLMCWFIYHTSQWWRFNTGGNILCESFNVPVHSLTSQLCYTTKTQL